MNTDFSPFFFFAAETGCWLHKHNELLVLYISLACSVIVSMQITTRYELIFRYIYIFKSIFSTHFFVIIFIPTLNSSNLSVGVLYLLYSRPLTFVATSSPILFASWKQLLLKRRMTSLNAHAMSSAKDETRESRMAVKTMTISRSNSENAKNLI